MVGALLDVATDWAEISGAEGKVHIHGSTGRVGDRLHRALDTIGTHGLQQESCIGGRLVFFAMNLDFELAARGIHDGTGAFLAVITERGLLF